jgi:outer membrane protein
VKILHPLDFPLLIAIVSLALYSGAVWADDLTAVPHDIEDSGFTILNHATNVTHWGLGGGLGLKASPYKEDGIKVSPFPLIFFDDKYIHVLGGALDVKVGKWYGVSAALRLQYSIGDGYRGSDASVLNGMENRQGAFWIGPSLKWSTSLGYLSGNYLVNGSKGQKAQIAFGKEINFSRFSVEPHVGAEYFNAKYVDYYDGVRADEVRAGRPVYIGKATYTESIGAKFDYHVTAHQTLIVDAGVSHLGSGITDSPIVGKKYIPKINLGYLYEFK